MFSEPKHEPGNPELKLNRQFLRSETWALAIVLVEFAILRVNS